MRLRIMALVLLCISCLAAHAQAAPYDITTIIPGQPWALTVKIQQAPGVLLETQGKSYLAYIVAAPPSVEQTYASFRCDVQHGVFTLRLTQEQTSALAGKHARWVLVYVPDIGPLQVLAGGNVEVKS